MIRGLLFAIVLVFGATATAQEMVGRPPGATTTRTAEEENPEDVVETPKDEPEPLPLARPTTASRPEPKGPILSNVKIDDRDVGRIMLALGQGVHGAGVGLELWELLHKDGTNRDAGLAGGLMLGGMGVGATLSIVLSRPGIGTGHASALNSGSLWGFWLGYSAAQTNYSTRGKARLVSAMLGQGAGMGLGELAFRLWDPTHGQTWVVDSFGFWSVMFTTGVILAATNYDFPPKSPTLAGAHFWAAAGGLALGGLVSKFAPHVPVGRVLLIDTMGVVGAIVFPIVGALVTNFYLELTPGWLLSMSGAAAGLGLTTLLTRNWHARPRATDPVSLHWGIAPVGEGAGLALGGAW